MKTQFFHHKTYPPLCIWSYFLTPPSPLRYSGEPTPAPEATDALMPTPGHPSPSLSDMSSLSPFPVSATGRIFMLVSYFKNDTDIPSPHVALYRKVCCTHHVLPPLPRKIQAP